MYAFSSKELENPIYPDSWHQEPTWLPVSKPGFSNFWTIATGFQWAWRALLRYHLGVGEVIVLQSTPSELKWAQMEFTNPSDSLVRLMDVCQAMEVQEAQMLFIWPSSALVRLKKENVPAHELNALPKEGFFIYKPVQMRPFLLHIIVWDDRYLECFHLHASQSRGPKLVLLCNLPNSMNSVSTQLIPSLCDEVHGGFWGWQGASDCVWCDCRSSQWGESYGFCLLQNKGEIEKVVLSDAAHILRSSWNLSRTIKQKNVIDVSRPRKMKAYLSEGRENIFWECCQLVISCFHVWNCVTHGQTCFWLSMEP